MNKRYRKDIIPNQEIIEALKDTACYTMDNNTTLSQHKKEYLATEKMRIKYTLTRRSVAPRRWFGLDIDLLTT
jgi:hypothetical protein